MFYCDCDSLYFSYHKEKKIPLLISHAVGHYKHIYPDDIVSFYSLGPKNYCLNYLNKSNEVQTVSKIKGFSLQSYFVYNEINSATYDLYLSKFLTDEIAKINLAQLCIRRDTKKIISKTCKYYTTFPFGFNKSNS